MLTIVAVLLTLSACMSGLYWIERVALLEAGRIEAAHTDQVNALHETIAELTRQRNGYRRAYATRNTNVTRG